jgi:cytochrome c peroxidase
MTAIWLAFAADRAAAEEVEAPEEPEAAEEVVAIGPLSGVAKPFPNAGLDPFVRPGPAGKAALVQLGKALFFDQQVGSDGVACASCHYHAGADVRLANALNPGTNAGSDSFGPTTSGRQGAANLTLTPADFPLNPFRSDDTVSSAGTRYGELVGSGTRRRALQDRCSSGEEAVFRFHNLDARRVEPRNTPTTINAVFFQRLFWDGRANNVFNGVNPFGQRDPNARVLKRTAAGVVAERVAIENAALASQANGPPLSDFEMSCANKSFADLGRRLLNKKALSFQEVHPNDSVLAGARSPNGKGLAQTYQQMIQRAFKDEYWRANGKYAVAPGGVVTQTSRGYTQMEANFPLFFGLSVAMYESTLVSGASPFDRGQLTALEEQGKDLFLNKGKCVNCHDGPEFSKAASHLFPEAEEEGLVERMLMATGTKPALYDNGFYNIGVTPTAHDVGVGGKDPFGHPLSFTRQYASGRKVDPFEVDEATFEAACEGPCKLPNERVAVDGAFKTPGLRNIGLTPPYFHNGGEATLEGVVQFYNHGGDRRSVGGGDTTGTGPLGQGGSGGSNLDPDIERLELTAAEEKALVAFLLALTDDRVACLAGPFDMPELILVNGHKAADTNRNGEADPKLVRLPPTGAGGRKADGRKCIKNSGDLFDPGMQVLLTDAPAQAPLQKPDATLGTLVNRIISGPRR